MEYMIGCNYWGSKWGTEMWANWDAESVENDLRTLAEYGVNTLRVFPNWRDFQPLHKLYGYIGEFNEYRLHGKSLMTDEYGLDTDCMEHFGMLIDFAKKYNIKLVVSIVTGWMSGRLFTPPALEGKNLINDPEALMLEVKFVRGFVRAFRGRDTIVAWDIGNECNCMADAGSREAAYVWTAMITNAIRAEDKTRPVMSGMHSLVNRQKDGYWTIEDQSELCDVLCTHPYPSPSTGADVDPISGLRSTMVSTAQTNYYASVGGKPCMIQEQGSFTNMLANADMAADWLRVNLFSSWANGSTGYLWWCAHEQSKLPFPPYTWVMIERELGLLRNDLSPKPVALEMKRIADVIKKLPKLPEKKIDAICVANGGKSFWGPAATSYILAKEAGFDLSFRHYKQPTFPRAGAYFFPCAKGWQCMPKETYDTLLDYVRDGASLCISVEDAQLTDCTAVFGLISDGMQKRTGKKTVDFDGTPLTIAHKTEFLMRPTTAEVLAKDEKGNVIFSRNAFGLGYVYYLGFPMEKMLWDAEGMLVDPTANPYYKIYQTVAEHLLAKKEIRSQTPDIGVTVHPVDNENCYAVAVNYSAKELPCRFVLGNDWKIAEVLYGNTESLARGEMAVLRLQKSV